jgi:hypothetical protein
VELIEGLSLKIIIVSQKYCRVWVNELGIECLYLDTKRAIK